MSVGEGAIAGLVGESVRALVGETARGSLGEADWLDRVWRRLVGAGFHELGIERDGGGLAPAARALTELGRATCNVPLVSTIVARSLGVSDDGVALATKRDFSRFIEDDGRLSGEFVVEEPLADQPLLVLAERDAWIVRRGEAVTVSSSAGLSLAPTLRATLRDAPAERIRDGTITASAARAARLLFLARALGAIDRALELVVDHVGNRVQFGQPLGRFQAMQHKLADCAVWIDAFRLTHQAAIEAHDWASPACADLADAAAALAPDLLGRASFEIEHAFGAIGFAEEHEGARLFRQVQTDVARLGGGRRARQSLAARRLAGDPLPVPDLGDAAQTVRQDVRAWLAANWTDDDRAAQSMQPFAVRNRSDTFVRRLGADGWLSLAWPKDIGGAALSPSGQAALVEELALVDAPVSGIVAAAWIVAPEIIRHGSPELRKELLPLIRSGQASFALGYSEPEAGSDLASLRTRAVRDGDDYVVQGQKLWGTGTEFATHIVMAVRTDPDAKPSSAGISLLVVPTDLPGITIQPSVALYGRTFCTQFFDDVRVPARYLLGPENGGWSVLGGALAAERIQMGGSIVEVLGLFEAFCAHVAHHSVLGRDGEASAMIGKFAAEFVAARLLAARSIELLDAERLPLVEGAMTKVFSGDLAERFARSAIDLLGADGLMGEGNRSAPLQGKLEQLLRKSIMLVIGGGAAEVQKTIIAQRGLRLPR